MQDLKIKTVTSLFWKLMERGGNALVSLVVQLVLARLLSPEEFGLLAIIIVFVNLGTVFVQSGLNSALIQVPDLEKGDYSTVFWLGIIGAAIIYAIVYFLAPYIGTFYGSSNLEWTLKVLALVLFLNAFNSVQVAKVTRDLELKKIFCATIFSVFLSGFSGIFLAYWGAGIWSLVVQQIIYQLVNCVVLSVIVDWKPTLCFSLRRAKILFSFGWKLLLSGILNTLYQSLSSLIIGKQFSQYDLGLVSQGEKYPQAIGNMIDGAIQPVIFSAVSHVQSDITSVKTIMQRALKTSAFLVFPTMSLFAIVAPSFVVLILGDQWETAVPFFQLYCLVYAMYPIQTANLQAINGLGRSDIFLKLEIIKKIYGTLIILFTAFVIQDIYAIVIGLIVSNFISIFVNSFPTNKLLGYGLFDQVKDLLPGILLTVVSSFLSWSVSMVCANYFVLLVLQSLIMILSYLLIGKLLKIEELEYLISTILEVVRPKNR